jgi:glycosyltransferase involved in cell wall biosynthesis
MSTACRVTVIAHELRGFRPAGGMGTATTFLALALARLGHSVEILLGKHALHSIDPEWEAVYRGAGVRIRPAPRPEEPVEPWQFDFPHSIELGLVADPPNVVIAHDFGAPAYTALRLRQAGIAFQDTLFVVFCHGPRRYVVDLSPTIPVGDLETVLGVSVLEQASVELADVVVSPSEYLLDWMRGQGWQLPARTRVIPYFTKSTALGEAVSPAVPPDAEPLRRLAFFGRVDEKKGLRLIAAVLNALGPDLIRGLELDFVGRTTRTWTRERAESLLSEETRHALAEVTFATELDQQQALGRLSRPGTLVVMPSLQENSPNTVYECLEKRIPFIASGVGGVPELVAPDDRARVLCEPTPEALEATLRRVLESGHVPEPARPAFDAATSVTGWSEVVELRPHDRLTGDPGPDERVDVVVVRRRSGDEPSRCLTALGRQTYSNFETTVASREDGLGRTSAPYVLILDDDDLPADDLLETLVRTAGATGAHAVSCGLRIRDAGGGTSIHFFEGEPLGLGAIRNGYGTVALFRRAALSEAVPTWTTARDPDWPLLARLAGSGASIVSVPKALVERRAGPGSVDDDPAAALLAVQPLEQALPEPARGAARLAAGLSASAAETSVTANGSALRRAAYVLRRFTTQTSRRLRPGSPR